jgi:hypothetical protein
MENIEDPPKQAPANLRSVRHAFGKWIGVEQNPCTCCGACCIAFRVSFYWAEGDDASAGGVPVCLTEKVTAFRRAMRRTGPPERHCVALEGIPGHKVRCTIYNHRPSVCRQFAPSWQEGVRNARCDQARAEIGLEALHPDSWKDIGAHESRIEAGNGNPLISPNQIDPSKGGSRAPFCSDHVKPGHHPSGSPPVR